MSNNPILDENGSLQYGLWTGAGYSAGVLSPSFTPYTNEEIGVTPIDGFDAVSKPHDIAYNNAQISLISDLNSGVSVRDAVSSYLNSLTVADVIFAENAVGTSTSSGWGDYIQGARH